MRKIIKIAGVAVLVSAITLSLTACTPKHTHKWGEWVRTETEHSRVCLTCNEEQRGEHDVNSKCPDCGAHMKVLALGFTSGGDSAHADFAKEANVWFPEMGKTHFFTYEASNDFGLLTDENLENYDLVMFLNNKPGSDSQWAAFKNYMDNGGAFMAFHASAFAMWSTPGEAPSEWEDWYQNTLLGCGEYGNAPRDPSDRGFTQYWNTWNPTSEPLTVETHDHFSTEHLECDVFDSAPCEWYEWSNNLFENDDVTVLLTLNPTPENPAGDDPRTGPNYEHQIWEGGHHAIAWASKTYNMVYMNWGHNLQSYNDFEKESKTFSCPEQCKFVLDSMFGLVTA